MSEITDNNKLQSSLSDQGESELENRNLKSSGTNPSVIFSFINIKGGAVRSVSE